MQTVVKEPNRKRRKTHTEQCKDDACNGCAVGEICIDLVDEEGHDLSNPLEIFKAAKEEQNKASLTDQDIDSSTHSTIVTKLYEKALKEFERLEILDLSYCSCLFEMGLFIQVKEYFEKTEAALEQYLKGPLTSTNYSDALLLLGRVYLELAHYCLGDAEESDSDTEFIPTNKKEQKYVQKAVNSFNKVIKY
jgi:tetratricopeptide (TPR) repeat protein